MRAKDGEAADEYEVVSLRPSWTGLSFLAFLLILPSRLYVRWLPLDPSWRGWRWLLWIPISAALAAIGLACGLVALRRAGRSGAAWIGVVLNGTAFVLLGLAAWALHYIRSR